MKRFLKLLLLTPMIILSSSCGQKDDPKPGEDPVTPPDLGPVDVVIISGQSNGVGCTRCAEIKKWETEEGEESGSEAYLRYTRGFSGIKIAYDCWTRDINRYYSQNKPESGDFMKVMLGQGNGLATFGPEIGIADTLNEKYANKLFLIKFACGASNMKEDWVKRNSPMYPKLIDFVKKQMANLVSKGYKPTIKAFCWMQGEGDSYDKYYQVYYQNTKEFVTNIRTDLKELAGNTDIPFIDAGISSASKWEYYQEVNDAKKQFAAESDINIYIDTIAAGLHTDQEPQGDIDICHYDSESEILLGKLFAQSFEPFLSKVDKK